MHRSIYDNPIACSVVTILFLVRFSLQASHTSGAIIFLAHIPLDRSNVRSMIEEHHEVHFIVISTFLGHLKHLDVIVSRHRIQS